jgi:geranylgeranyl pyrophosphate synthase
MTISLQETMVHISASLIHNLNMKLAKSAPLISMSFLLGTIFQSDKPENPVMREMMQYSGKLIGIILQLHID